MLGLVANNDVAVVHSASANVTSDLTIDAAMMSLKHSFYVQNWDQGANSVHHRQPLLRRRFRQPHHQRRDHAGVPRPGRYVRHRYRPVLSGYNKQYTYDSRLKYLSPPYFLNPTQSAWLRISYAEVHAEAGSVGPQYDRSNTSGQYVGCRAGLLASMPRMPADRDVIRAPKGMLDVLPPESARWIDVVARFAARAERFGYGLLLTPIVEHYEVFARVGETTDVVRKEMYDFVDRGGRRLALRPEGTAPVVRGLRATPPDDPVEGLVPRTELPGRAAAGRALPPALAAGRGGASGSTIPTSTSRSSSCSGGSSATSASATSACSSTRWATPRRATRYREVLLAYWHAHADADRCRDGARGGEPVAYPRFEASRLVRDARARAAAR